MSKDFVANRDRQLSLFLSAISIIAILVTAYLASVALTSSKVAGCGGGTIFDCDDVINSRWSRWMGVPVSFLALGLYIGLLTLSVSRLAKSNITKPANDLAWNAIATIAFAAGLASIWFVSLQIFVLKHLCIWCLVAHSCGLMAVAGLLWFRPPIAKLGRAAVLSLIGFLTLAGGQLLLRPVTFKLIEHEVVPVANQGEAAVFEFSPTATPLPISLLMENSHLGDWAFLITDPTRLLPVWMSGQVSQTSSENGANAVSDGGKRIAAHPRRLVSMSGGSIQLDVAQWPLLGKPDAKFIFVEMFDYTCDHCRRTHVAISEAKKMLGDDLSVVLLTIPLNSNCNSAVTVTGPRMAESCEISKLSIAVWRIAPEKFASFHAAIMTAPSPPTFADAKAVAIRILGVGSQEKLSAEIAAPPVSQYITQHVELYKRVGAGNVPKMLFPTTTVVGEFTSPERLVKIIQEQLGHQNSVPINQ